jgi:hypothetical protein
MRRVRLRGRDQFDILKRRQHRDEIEGLKDKAHVLVAPVGQLGFVQGRHVDVLHPAGAAGRSVDAGDDVQ